MHSVSAQSGCQQRHHPAKFRPGKPVDLGYQHSIRGAQLSLHSVGRPAVAELSQDALSVCQDDNPVQADMLLGSDQPKPLKRSA
jgi:hypothetical protein